MATISSHTLNAADGTHAGGIRVTMINHSTGLKLFESEMDEAGRLSETVNLLGADPAHRYELTFNTSDYWISKGFKQAHIVDEIVLRFLMPDADARYHKPIILSPNGYSVWSSVAEASQTN